MWDALRPHSRHFMTIVAAVFVVALLSAVAVLTPTTSYDAVATVWNRATPTSINMTLASTDAQEGANVHVEGLLTGKSGINNGRIALSVILPDGTTSNPAQGPTVYSGNGGKFQVDYVPTMVGLYTINATFSGNSKYSMASNTVSFEVAAPSSAGNSALNSTPSSNQTTTKSVSSIALSMASSSVEAGSKMHVDGLLSGPASIVNANVSLKVTLPGGSVAYPVQGSSTVTDGLGKFSMDYVPANPGTYRFSATYAGNSTILDSSYGVNCTSTSAQVTTAKVLVYPSGNLYIAKDMTTGTTIYSSSDLNAVMSAAFNDLTPGRTAKEKVLMQGDFTLTSTRAVSLPSHIALELDGTLAQASSSQYATILSAVDRTDVEVTGGMWYGGSVSTDYALYFEGCTDLYVHGCEVIGNGGPGGMELYDCKNAAITNNNLHDSTTTALLILGFSSSIEIGYNTISDTQYGGILVLTGPYDDSIVQTAQNVWIHHNTITRTVRSGIALYPDGREDIISSCTIEYNALTDVGVIGRAGGVMITVSGGFYNSEGKNGQTNDCIIRYNTCRNTGSYNQGGGMIAVGGERNQIYGNQCYNSDAPSISLEYCYHSVVENNIIDTTRLEWGCGILVSGSCYNTIRNNQITNTNCHGIIIQPNEDDSSSYNVISGNKIAPSGPYKCGVLIRGPATMTYGTVAIQTGNQVADNTFANISEDYPNGVSDGGTRTVISGNTVN